MEVTYHNPVYDANFPDPFVLKYCGEYWAYGTGAWRDGRWFGILRSRDLVHWEDVGGALEPLPGHLPERWAPEVSYHNGRFYLYYSIGDEATMQIRVAVADHPAGPFVDSGPISREPFAIDAHIFVDDDGSRHMFYATDFLEHTHVGTGTARLRLADPLTPLGEPVPVTRARFDWQVYDPNRAEKGGVRWHTVEGPFVLKRKGRYYQMFSGGNWQNPTYGVSYATADRVDPPGEWAQHADGDRLLPILRTIPGAVVGPGHNSAVRGPDNRQLFCVYHRWAADNSGRVMAIDPLDWAGDRMLLIGPSTTPRLIALPSLADFFEGTQLAPHWEARAGEWRAENGAAIGSTDALARCRHPAPHYLAELSLRALDPAAAGGYGVMLGDALRFLIHPAANRASVATRSGAGWEEQLLALPADFAPGAFHLLRVEVNAGLVRLALDEAALRWSARLPAGSDLPIALCCAGAPAAFAGFALSAGWLDEMDGPAEPPPGWEGTHAWHVQDGELRPPPGPELTWLSKGPLPAAYELAVNVALDAADESARALVIAPAAGADDRGPELALAVEDGQWALVYDQDGSPERLPLPAQFDPSEPRQLRFRVAGGRIAVSWENAELGELPAPASPSRVAIGGRAAARFEMIRVRDLGGEGGTHQ